MAAAEKSGGAIARQTSIYSLTLDEIQNTLEPGKNFGSMNMDEFLKNIWTAEESQAIAAAIAPETSSGALFRQPSLRQPLPRTLSQKTVDEVWKDIHRPGESEGDAVKLAQGQMTLGEMTLEDFLVKAGVMKDEEGVAFPVKKSNVEVGGALSLAQAPLEQQQQQQQQQQDWLASQYGNPAAMVTIAQQQQQQQHFLQQQAVEVAAYMNAKGMNGLGFSSGSPPSPGSDSQGNGFGLSSGGYGMDTRGRKRGLDGPVEVVLERRQRRMIKNRESAARSRARKQAYTVELEAEVTHLKEENMKLKKMQEEAEMRDRKRTQVLERIAAKNQNQNNQNQNQNQNQNHQSSSAGVNKPKALRRTLTGPW